MFAGKYLVAIEGDNAVLRFSRDWTDATAPVATGLVAQRLARFAVRNGLSPRKVFRIGQGESPDIIVPAAYLTDKAFAFAILDDGKAMQAKVDRAKTVSSFTRTKVGRRAIKRYASKFGLAY